jgi:hypothetical protein
VTAIDSFISRWAASGAAERATYIVFYRCSPFVLGTNQGVYDLGLPSATRFVHACRGSAALDKAQFLLFNIYL